MELPRKADPQDKTYQAYCVFQQEVMENDNKPREALGHGINVEVAINGIYFFRMESNTEYKRTLPHWQYSASSNTRCLRGINELRVVSNTTVDFIGFFYRHIGVGAAQQKLRLHQQLANLGNLDYYLIGRLDNHLDKSPYGDIQEVFRFHKDHEADFRHIYSRAEVLLLRSRLWGDVPEERGWICALTENHILFDEVVERDVLEGSIDRYRTIILPDNEQMSSELCAKLDDYTARGGIVISSGRSGRYDETFSTRTNSPLACLGIERLEYTREDMVSAMFLIGSNEKEMFPSFADIDAVAFGDLLTYQMYSPKAKTYFHLLPPQPFGPPERCYGGDETTYPGISVHPVGQGKGISVPFMLGSLYYKEGYENSFFLIKDILTSLCGLQSVAPDLTSMVEVTLGINETSEFALVQLFNNTGHFGNTPFQAHSRR